MKAMITVGISGSGKSTEFSKTENLHFVRIERDIMRKRIMTERFKWNEEGDINFWSVWKFNKADENEVTERCDAIIRDCAKQGADIAITDTNLNKKYRDKLVEKLNGLGYEVEFKVFNVDVMEAIKRDEKRRDTVGHQVIFKQYNDLVNDPDFGRKKYVPDVTKPRCVIVDVDGTLASMDGKRGPFEWDKVGGDSVHDYVKMIVNNLPETVIVIVLSGRDGICYDLTKTWLIDNGIRHDHLWMRTAGDMRKDSDIKSEIFWEKIAHKYNVVCAIDDRPVMIRTWRDIGLNTLACGNQTIEF